MIYVANFSLNNSFIKLDIENNDDPKEIVEEHAEYLAKQLGVNFIYLESSDGT